MSNRYFKGEKVLLYTKFYDENGNIPDNIDNARVRILHENNGKIYQDMNWTELKNIGGNEFFSKYNIPFNYDNGIYPAFYHHLRRDLPCHRPFLLYVIPVSGHAAYHAEKSRDLWRLCHWPDPYGQHLRCPACKTDLCASGSGRHRKEFLSSGT